MIYSFGDKRINTKQVHAIGDPEHTGLDFIIKVFFIGGVVDAKFWEVAKEKEFIVWQRIKKPNGPHNEISEITECGLKQKDGSISWSNSVNYFNYNFYDSLLHEYMEIQIGILSRLIQEDK